MAMAKSTHATSDARDKPTICESDPNQQRIGTTEQEQRQVWSPEANHNSTSGKGSHNGELSDTEAIHVVELGSALAQKESYRQITSDNTKTIHTNAQRARR